MPDVPWVGLSDPSYRRPSSSIVRETPSSSTFSLNTTTQTIHMYELSNILLDIYFTQDYLHMTLFVRKRTLGTSETSPLL